VLSGRGLCDELITRPEESYLLCCVVVCDLETSRMGAAYIYDISHLRVNNHVLLWIFSCCIADSRNQKWTGVAQCVRAGWRLSREFTINGA